MRVEAFTITNYRGIRHAECSNLSSEPLILISGKNGTGKSLILEAITLIYSARWFDPALRVGPFGQAAKVRLVLKLGASEIEQLSEWNRSLGTGLPSPDEIVVIHHSIGKDGSVRTESDHSAFADTLRNAEFQKLHAFSRMEFLPSVRILPTNQGMAVDPGVLDPQRVAQERQAMLDQYLQTRQPASLGNVFTYLATVDYVDLMAQRDQRPESDEFKKLVAPFREATGKSIRPPTSQDDLSIQMAVKLPGSNLSHSINGLSAGEQELLSLSYFVRRANAAGGVLLLDEPEQHLHPTLQSAVLRQVAEMSPGAQVLAVTHSVNILSAVSSTAILSMSPPHVESASQLTALSDDDARLALIAELGLTAADLVQADYVIVVEGESDESLLKALFPVEVAKAAFVVAGDIHGVMKVREGLEKVDQVLPFICLRDRDFLTDAQRESLMSKFDHLYIWNRRMIENELLDPTLIAEVFRRAGSQASATAISGLLPSLLEDSDKEEVVLTMLEHHLAAVKPSEGMPDLPKGLDRIRASYAYLAEAAAERVVQFDIVHSEVVAEIERRWVTDWVTLVEGKNLLGRLARKSPVKDVRAAIAAAYVAEAGARPAGMIALGSRLKALAGLLDDAGDNPQT